MSVIYEIVYTRTHEIEDTLITVDTCYVYTGFSWRPPTPSYGPLHKTEAAPPERVDSSGCTQA